MPRLSTRQEVSPTDFACSPEVQELCERVSVFMEAHAYLAEAVFERQIAEGGRWQLTAIMEELKAKTKTEGLWNLLLPEPEYDTGLADHEHAPLTEIMGRSLIGPRPLNCVVSGTGNTEVPMYHGSEEQKHTWLGPLLSGEIHSAFAMTEPGTASSDAANMEIRAKRQGDNWVINGRKWWTSGACNPRCKVLIFMGLTNPDAPHHQQHSTILVPVDTPGVKILCPLSVFSYDDASYGHVEVLSENIWVLYESVIPGEDRGFEVAQGYLGSSRIHHRMCSIGIAERALELMRKHAVSRTTFDKPPARLGGNIDHIVDSRTKINMARLLALQAAHMMDTMGNKIAQSEIVQIKVVTPGVTLKVVDRTVRMHGDAGVSNGFPLAYRYAMQRTPHLTDGPNEVHRATIDKFGLGKYVSREMLHSNR